MCLGDWQVDGLCACNRPTWRPPCETCNILSNCRSTAVHQAFQDFRCKKVDNMLQLTLQHEGMKHPYKSNFIQFGQHFSDRSNPVHPHPLSSMSILTRNQGWTCHVCQVFDNELLTNSSVGQTATLPCSHGHL
jgi:hypothetical protein